MASKAMKLPAVTKPVTKGAKAMIAPTNFAAVGGLVGSSIVETSVIKAFPQWFGVNDGQSVLSPAQKRNRIIGRAATGAVVGGILISQKSPLMKAAGVGMLAGATWHSLREAGVNI